MKQVDPNKFFSKLKWIDERPLSQVIEPYRKHIFQQALYTFEGAKPKHNLVLSGRAKKELEVERPDPRRPLSFACLEVSGRESMLRASK